MTPRENLMRLLRRDGHVSVPCSFSLCPSLEVQYHEKIKTLLPYAEYFQFPWRDAPEPVATDTDVSRFLPYHDRIDENVTIDLWGVGHRRYETSMHMTQMLYPLAGASTTEAIEQYPLPVFTEANNAHLRQAVAAIHARGLAAVGNMQCTIWERAWYLRGMENLMMDMMAEDPMASCLFERVEASAVDRALLLAKAGVDILFLGDDIGMQRTIMMSMPLYKRWIAPSLRRVIDKAKSIKSDILIFYHSCGFITPFIPLLIDAGVDVLNPVQPECMDFQEIYAAYGEHLAFHGTLGTQTTMPFGSVQEVRETVHRNLDIAGARGGLFPAPTHLLEPEVPWENVLAYVDACASYGR